MADWQENRHAETIWSLADRAKDRIRGSMLYGIQVDENDPVMALAAMEAAIEYASQRARLERK